MYLDHHALKHISRILNMIDAGALLLNSDGAVLFPEGDSRRLTLPEAIREKSSGVLVYGGVTLAAVTVNSCPDNSQVMYICLNGDSNEVKNYALLCAELISLTLENYSDSSEKIHAFRKIFRGESSKMELESICSEFSLPLRDTFCVVCVQTIGAAGDIISVALDEITAGTKAFWADISSNMYAVATFVPEENACAAMMNCANVLSEKLRDRGVEAFFGISDPHDSLHEIHDAVIEASVSINVGGLYCPTERIFIYRKLLLERFVNSLNDTMAQSYSAKVFNQSTTRLFTDEMMNTIDVFFKSNLNLSEAARILGIHRNTLVYRLEKIQAVTGFDLREFDDAITFKMMMLLNRNSIAGKPRI